MDVLGLSRLVRTTMSVDGLQIVPRYSSDWRGGQPKRVNSQALLKKEVISSLFSP